MNQSNDPTPETSGPVECTPARDPAVRWFIMAALLIGVGVWCWSDRDKGAARSNINEKLTYSLNNYGPFLLVPAGLVLAGAAVRFLTRKLAADAEGIGYQGGDRIAWGDVTELDATRLNKGFLYIHYGQGRKLALDSWKLRNFRQMVAFIDKHVPAERQKR